MKTEMLSQKSNYDYEARMSELSDTKTGLVTCESCIAGKRMEICAIFAGPPCTFHETGPSSVAV